MMPWKVKTVLAAQEFSYQQCWMFQKKNLDEVKAKSMKNAEAYFPLILEVAWVGKKKHFVPKLFWH